MTQNKLLLTPALLALLGLAGCSTMQSQADAVAAQKTVEVEIEHPVRPFPAETLFDLLVAEMAGSRNEYGLALTKYAKQAFATRDPAVVARATRVAAFLNAGAYARDLSLLWVDLEPGNLEARRFAAHYLSQSRQLIQAFPHAIFMLKNGEGEPLRTIASFAATINGTQRAELLGKYQSLAPELADNPDVLLTKATLLWQQGDSEQAMVTALQLTMNNPTNEAALLLISQILHQQGQLEAALASLDQSLQVLPESKRLHLQAARLWAEKDLDRARQELSRLVIMFPDDDSLIYSLAMISAETGMFEDAKLLLRRILNSPERGIESHFQLAKVLEQEGDTEQAALHYRQVSSGQHLISAASRLSRLLATKEKTTEATLYLKQLRQQHPDNSALLYQVESEMLEFIGEPQLAYDTLSEALKGHSDDVQLLYARSLISERSDDFPRAEQDLRTIIENNPNNAMALNALGYSLTNHTKRYEEAFELISKALEIKPGDPATLDSLGWVLFHLGRHEEALTHLRQAMELLADPEVAAHLGEVLWTVGRTEEALTVWQSSLSVNPESPVITQTMERLKVPAQEASAATKTSTAPEK